MPPEKVLIISKDKGLQDLVDLVLGFDAEIESRIPEDYYERYDAIALHHLPENIAELGSNYDMPVIASDKLAEQIEKEGYSSLAAICTKEAQISKIRDLLARRDATKPVWKTIQTNFKLRYADLDTAIAKLIREQGISKPEAFYTFIETNAQNFEVIKDKLEISVATAHAELEAYLGLLKKSLGKPNEEHFRREAEKKLKEYLDHAQKRREDISTVLKLTGPSVEGGTHYLYVDLAQIRQEEPEFSFLKAIKLKENIPQKLIAYIIYNDTKYFDRRKQGVPFRLPASMPPIQLGDANYLLREGIIGPDLEDILVLVRRRIAKKDSRSAWLQSFRDICTNQVLRDIVQWQTLAPQITAPEIPNTPEWIVEHSKRNLNAAFDSYSKYLQTSDAEKQLWESAIKLFNPTDLNLKKETIVRHFDASTSNIKLFTGRLRQPTMEDLESIASARGKKLKASARKQIAKKLYYVDTGFTYAHEDEDFMHMACSFGLHDDEKTPRERLSKIVYLYNQFKSNRRGKGTRHSALDFNLNGFYRNFVSGHLNLVRYERDKRNLRQAREKHAHRLGLANEFVKSAIAGIMPQGGDGFPEEQKTSPTSIFNSIEGHEKMLASETDYSKRLETGRLIELRCLYALQYFADKYEKIKPQYLAASQPASQ